MKLESIEAGTQQRVYFPENDLKEVFSNLLVSIGEDVDRDGLKNTPERAANAFKFLTHGYSLDIKDVLNGALFSCDNSEMVIVKSIELFSLCEHHLLPIIGKCHVAYIPNGMIVGLSKIARIVDMYARRLQVQERMTQEIANAITEAINPLGVGVVIDATHLCMMARGVEKQCSCVQTRSMLGLFQENADVRREFLSSLPQ